MSSERGSVTIWTLVATAVVLLTAATTAAYGLAVVARHRAAGAADAAALGGAAVVVTGTSAACEHARRAATAAGGRLVSCEVAGAMVSVAAEATLPGWLAWAGAPQVRARAGPVMNILPKPGRDGYAS